MLGDVADLAALLSWAGGFWEQVGEEEEEQHFRFSLLFRFEVGEALLDLKTKASNFYVYEAFLAGRRFLVLQAWPYLSYAADPDDITVWRNGQLLRFLLGDVGVSVWRIVKEHFFGAVLMWEFGADGPEEEEVAEILGSCPV
ncbi:hypothetical protein F4777DRAFT_574591 [Nemania sp. FL0916]|nr:hypothetical protein F4777DRAFT_574591 [Nemania sp. FL0916]